MKSISIMSKLLILTAVGGLVGLVAASKDCRFAKAYTYQELASSTQKRNDFLSQLFHKEAAFFREYGYNLTTGLAIAETRLNERTGMPE
jgi:hypothetical protein